DDRRHPRHPVGSQSGAQGAIDSRGEEAVTDRAADHAGGIVRRLERVPPPSGSGGRRRGDRRHPRCDRPLAASERHRNGVRGGRLPRPRFALTPRWRRRGGQLCSPDSRGGPMVVEEWLEAYRRAWEERDPEAAAALFTEDAEYLDNIYGEPHRGRDRGRAYWSDVTAALRGHGQRRDDDRRDGHDRGRGRAMPRGRHAQSPEGARLVGVASGDGRAATGNEKLNRTTKQDERAQVVPHTPPAGVSLTPPF